MENRTERETEKVKAELATTRPQCANKSAGGVRVSSLKAARGARKATASKGSKVESEDEEEEAASAEMAPTAAANEDKSADSKDKNDEEEANHDGDARKARPVAEDADADHRKEPEVNNKEQATTDSASQCDAYAACCLLVVSPAASATSSSWVFSYPQILGRCIRQF
ncbi:hypothetical protein MTO96_012509 [Rhipicephalus appendiculatus]